MTLVEVLAVMAAMGIAALVQSLSGFGFALLAVPLMSLAVDVRLAVVVSTLVAMGTTLLHAWRERSSADRPTVRRLVLASVVGMPFGLAAFVWTSERTLKVALGIVVVVMTLLLLRGTTIPRESRASEWTLGAASGALATSLSTNGPPLVFLLQARGHTPEEFRGTISMVFAAVNTITLVMFIAARRLSGDALVLGMLVLPVVALATGAGYRLRRHVDGERFRALVLVLLVLSGASAIVTAL